MATVTYVLKEPNLTNETLVYLIFRFNNQKLKYSTGQKIHPKNWNFNDQKAKSLRGFKEAETINFLLDELKAAANNAYRTLLLEGSTPTPELIKQRLNQALKKEDVSSKDLADFAHKTLESSNRKASTKRAIKQTIRLLNDFKKSTGKGLHFDTIDLDFYDKYVSYAKSCGYSQNTIGNHIKNVKVFMREAFERGLTKNLSFKSRGFKKLEEESTNIYLSSDEIRRFEELDLSESPRLEKVRDLFLVACHTGLRFSDLSQLRKENINHKKRFLQIRTQKTDETVVIPINSSFNKMIEKYDGGFPPAISNEKMNEYLKELAEKVKLNQKIEIVSTKGGERHREIFKKHELVTVHTARRSFATNAYLANVPTISIMKITGHKTEKAFLKYIKISQEDNANKLLNHPFFN